MVELLRSRLLRSRLVRSRLLVLVAAIALAACGAADVAAPDSTAAATGGQAGSTASAGDGDGARGEAVGEVVQVLNVESFMNGGPASSGDAIEPRAELSTDATGVVRFVFSVANAECVLIKSSAVVVLGDGRRLLRQVRGETACEVDSPDRAVEFTNRGRIVRVRRGILRLTASAGGGGTQVLGGRAQALDPDGGDAVDMGPGDSTGWDTSGALNSDDEPSAPTDDVDVALTALEDGTETDSGLDADTSVGDGGSDTDADTTGEGDGTIDDSAGTTTDDDGTGTGTGTGDSSGTTDDDADTTDENADAGTTDDDGGSADTTDQSPDDTGAGQDTSDLP
jgi:hypothetical protein